MANKRHFRWLEHIPVVLKYVGVFRPRLYNAPKIFCPRHFEFEIEEREVVHGLRDTSENIKMKI